MEVAHESYLRERERELATDGANRVGNLICARRSIMEFSSGSKLFRSLSHSDRSSSASFQSSFQVPQKVSSPCVCPPAKVELPKQQIGPSRNSGHLPNSTKYLFVFALCLARRSNGESQRCSNEWRRGIKESISKTNKRTHTNDPSHRRQQQCKTTQL